MNRPVICRYCGQTLGHATRVNTRETMHAVHIARCPTLLQRKRTNR